jgi:predicted DNA-binding protein (MmcQ/YjbR family)
MSYPWIDEYFMSKSGIASDFQQDWQATRYFLADKMVGMVGGDKYGKPIVTMKCDPVFAEVLRNQYEDIIPAYHMNKQHWNSVYLEGKVPDVVMKDMIDLAYRLVMEKLPEKSRKSLMQNDG